MRAKIQVNFEQVHDIICYNKWVMVAKRREHHWSMSVMHKISFFFSLPTSISWLRGKNVNENNTIFSVKSEKKTECEKALCQKKEREREQKKRNDDVSKRDLGT